MHEIDKQYLIEMLHSKEEQSSSLHLPSESDGI
jgi:hypothetical protein